MTTLRWQSGPWRFVLPAGSSYLVVYRGEDSVPYDMAPRPPRPQTTEASFRAACVSWLITASPVGR